MEFSAEQTHAIRRSEAEMAELVKLFETLPNSAKPVSRSGEYNCPGTVSPYLVGDEEGARHSRGGARRSQRFCQ
jgi:hypothetical protein